MFSYILLVSNHIRIYKVYTHILYLFYSVFFYIISWETEGCYHYPNMFCWEPEGHYHHRLCTANAPFWFSTEHLWILIAPFWLSTDNIFGYNFHVFVGLGRINLHISRNIFYIVHYVCWRKFWENLFLSISL